MMPRSLMNRTTFTCCTWLLALLMGSSTLAQTQPKKRSSKHVAEQEEVPVKPVYMYPSPPSSLEEPPDYYNQVHTYVDQMPTLNGQNAVAASIAAIKQYVVVPPTAPNGRLFVYFEVDKTGSARHPQIAKGLRADVDSAVVAAVRQLPRFSPGKQAGQAVAVSLMVPVTIPAKKQL
ncbi:MAG: hypothetical protein EOO60_05940 [Hymenobacter sp.]|nr:MAG: hypothetical protein EOO60_05940 [Hymenobacter sp.]